jgi:tetratricopeptide (TPR) repeat protein
LIATSQFDIARKVLIRALQLYPEDQKLLIMMGDLQQEMGFTEQAVLYYNRAARVDTSTPEGKEADKKLLTFPPVLTDKERGSVHMAWREVGGIAFFYLLLAWQDAGLNLSRMDIAHWLGIGISVIGGYLLVSATSSAQQIPLASWLGGEKPERKPYDIEMRGGALHESTQLPTIPRDARIMLGIAGGLLLMLAFWLVFGEAIQMLRDPIPVVDPLYGPF